MLERLQAEGLALLPALGKTAPFRPRAVTSNTQGNPQKPVTGSVGEYSPLLLRLVQGADLSDLSRNPTQTKDLTMFACSVSAA